MPKRAFPFNNCTPMQLKTHVGNKHVNNNEEHMEFVYAKTQSLLKAGVKAMEKVKKDSSLSAGCQNCKKVLHQNELTICRFCEKKICSYCFNVCFVCEQNFCPLCSVICYDDPMEKAYCLSCTGT